MAQLQIANIAKDDQEVQAIGNISAWGLAKDLHHLKRRQQQRAIPDVMLQIAMVYGIKSYNRGAALYTLTDRQLAKSPYAKYTQELRGLTVVCNAKSTLDISTAYWNKKIIRHTKKK
jgi:hypothetical protein